MPICVGNPLQNNLENAPSEQVVDKTDLFYCELLASPSSLLNRTVLHAAGELFVRGFRSGTDLSGENELR